MRGGKRKSPICLIFLAGVAVGFFAPSAAVLLVCAAVALLGLMGKL